MTATVTLPQRPVVSMPTVRIGDWVYWYSGGDRNQQPAPALVTQVNQRSLCLAIVRPNIKNFDPIDGVRYLDDNEAKDHEFIEDGGWDVMDRTPQISIPKVPLNKDKA